MNKIKFSAKTFSFGLEDQLNYLGLNVNVKSFWQDDKEHINIDFPDDGENTLSSCKDQVTDVMGNYGREDVWIGYSVDSFWSDGSITVKITFDEEQ